MRGFRGLMSFIPAALGLIWIGLGQRGRVRTAYWRWREHTAFGDPGTYKVSPRSRLRALWAFGRWSWRMRRGG